MGKFFNMGFITDTSSLRNRHRRNKKYVSGLLKKAMGNAEATNCHAMDATIVVIKAPRKPMLKNFCTPSETPKIVSSPSGSILREVHRAMKNIQDTTQS